jgi:hypothetical protein
MTAGGSPHPDGWYRGPAVVRVGGDEVEAPIVLSGRFEPIDGRFHWNGRISADDRLAGHVRAGRLAATVRVPGGSEAPARLAEPDPWGRIRVTGTGRPPHWPTPEPSGGGLSAPTGPPPAGAADR